MLEQLHLVDYVIGFVNLQWKGCESAQFKKFSQSLT